MREVSIDFLRVFEVSVRYPPVIELGMMDSIWRRWTSRRRCYVFGRLVQCVEWRVPIEGSTSKEKLHGVLTAEIYSSW